jgi:hypothetical protein
MTSPVSIGDAIMLSQLAYKIGRAFSSGRKSAPAEFEEVQKHLFALGGALGLLANDKSEKPISSPGRAQKALKEGDVVDVQDQMLEQMTLNCRETLIHLETLVNKYMEIDPNSKTSAETTLRSWQQEVRKNWKKIKWTTEGGDLDKLRNNLAVHVSGLTLALSAMHRLVSKMASMKAATHYHNIGHKHRISKTTSPNFIICLKKSTAGMRIV